MDKDASKRKGSRLKAQDAAEKDLAAASAANSQRSPSGAAADTGTIASTDTPDTAHPQRSPRLRLARPNLTGLAARWRDITLISRLSDASRTATLPAAIARPGQALRDRLRRRRRRARKDRLQDWQHWSRFRLWRHTRPLWGSIFMIVAGAVMIVDAAFFLSLAFLVQSLWPAFLVGGLLLVMGLIQLFLPTYAVITGSIGLVLSLVSLLVASFGGCGVGMLLGIIGSALSIAWRPVKRSRLIAASSSRTR